MPRVFTKTKIKLGADRKCGKCGHEIQPGEKYRQWSFRYGGTYYRCDKPECTPRPSDLTQSKLGEVYAAIEGAEDGMSAASTAEEITELVISVGADVSNVADEYEEAAEPFGNQGENQERSEELRSFAEELEGFELDAEIPEDEECDECEGTGGQKEQESNGEVSDIDCPGCGGEGTVAVDGETLEEALEAARDEALEALSNCPL